MARGQKIDDRLKQLILMELAVNGNCSEVARVFGLADSTVRTIRDKNKDNYVKLREEKQRDIIDQAAEWKIDIAKRMQRSVEKALKLSESRIDRALEKEEELDELISEIEHDTDMHEKTKSALISKIRNLQILNVKELSTYIGTLYDKQALAKGDSTSNVNMNAEIIELTPEERQKRIKELLSKSNM